MPMKALIVDDERLARNELKRLLENFPAVEVIGEAANTEEASQLIEELQPDVVFLDIQMPGKTGFEWLEEWDGFLPEIIFTTAFDEYALKAFEVNALDYVLKPIELARLSESIQKLESRFLQPAPHQSRFPILQTDGGLLREQNRPDRQHQNLFLLQ